MKLFIVLACLIIAISCSSDEELWTKFKQDHEKIYKSLREDKFRFTIFKTNLRTIEEHNAKYEKGEHSWFMGINQFTDLTDEEFHEKYLSTIPNVVNSTATFSLPANLSIPDSIDWREEAVLSVKDQGTCGSCWAFSAVAALEGQNALKHRKRIDLSPQELVDCSDSYDNEGCNGGLMDSAFRYVRDHGISKLSDYPYINSEQKCKNQRNSAGIKISGFTDIPSNEAALKQAVATVGPVSVAINANFIQRYAGGIYDNFFCFGNLNHGVLAAGYGSEGNHDYWLVKNSWGTKWGESGYIKMTRNKFNQCGIASQASYPNLE